MYECECTYYRCGTKSVCVCEFGTQRKQCLCITSRSVLFLNSFGVFLCDGRGTVLKVLCWLYAGFTWEFVSLLPFQDFLTRKSWSQLFRKVESSFLSKLYHLLQEVCFSYVRQTFVFCLVLIQFECCVRIFFTFEV